MGAPRARLKFKGGKGVATYLGVLLGASLQGLLAFALTWLSMAFLFRYSSLSALMASLATPFLLYSVGQFQMAEMFLAMTLLLWLKHNENIHRLMMGEESRIGSKSKAESGGDAGA